VYVRPRSRSRGSYATLVAMAISLPMTPVLGLLTFERVLLQRDEQAAALVSNDRGARFLLWQAQTHAEQTEHLYLEVTPTRLRELQTHAVSLGDAFRAPEAGVYWSMLPRQGELDAVSYAFALTSALVYQLTEVPEAMLPDRELFLPGLPFGPLLHDLGESVYLTTRATQLAPPTESFLSPKSGDMP
jgi:hypothetical protein